MGSEPAKSKGPEGCSKVRNPKRKSLGKLGFPASREILGKLAGIGISNCDIVGVVGCNGALYVRIPY